jgi:nucleotide-binding universal stress UspA family protein
MKTRFIIPIDFSPYSASQLILAHEWARKVLAEILVVHQADIDVPYITDPMVKERAKEVERAEVEEKLNAYVQKIIPTANNVSSLVVEEPIEIALKELPREGYNDLIFAGLKGTGLLKKIFIGSTTVKLIENVNELIIAVPKNMKMTVPDTLYVAVHYKYHLNLEALDRLVNIFYYKLAKIHLITVLKEGDEEDKSNFFMEGLQKRVNKITLTTVETFKGQDAQFELKRYMLDHQSGILAIQNGGRTHYESEYRSFLINDLVYDASIPMIVLPN